MEYTITQYFEGAVFVLFLFGVASFMGMLTWVVPCAYRAVKRGVIDKPGPFEAVFTAAGAMVFLATLYVVASLFYIDPGA